MKKAVVPVSFDAEKLSAARLHMAQKDLSFEEEMEKAADALYGRYVPAGVREFIGLNAGNRTAARPKKSKPSSSFGGVQSDTDGGSEP